MSELISLTLVEQKLTENLKAKNTLAVAVLRGLKTRIQNEQIAQGGELTEEQLIALVKSEVKRRKEAIEGFKSAGREEQAQSEADEIQVLSAFMPEQISEEQIIEVIDQKISENNWTKADFGSAMGQLKQHFGASADGAVISQILKNKLT
ncbi:MAG: GatB/YqeY domain-containing protein [Candidatus Doudnabacteria bacterium]